jgi:outer membrane protein insertion porin family
MRKAARLSPLVVLGVFCAIAGPHAAAQAQADAQAAPARPTITSIDVQGLRTLAQESLLFYLGLEVGQPLDERRLNANLHDLWARNLVDDVQVETTPERNGVKLLIKVQERAVLRSIVYEGLKRIANTDITDRIVKDRIRLHEGEPIDFGELTRLKATLEDMYHEKGYRFAEVKYKMEDVTPGERRVTFTVDEGDRVRIQKIAFKGNTVFGDWRLRWSMKKTAQTNMVARFLKHDIYNPATAREDLDKVRDLYRSVGYKNAVISDPLIDVRALNPNAATAKEKKRRLFLTVPVDEGQRFKFGDISIEGNKKYTDAQLLRAFRRHSGGWLRSKIVSDGVEKITDQYKNTGFIEANVSTELKERSSSDAPAKAGAPNDAPAKAGAQNNVADVIVHVNEGDQYTVGRIEFHGNTRTHDKVLRRELRVQEGMLLNIAGIKNSVYKVEQLQYFKPDKNDPVEFADYNQDKKTVDLVFKGEEADRTELQIGGGWSQPYGFFGQLSVRTQNFLGRGESVGVSVQSGGVQDIFDVSYFVPWLLDRPQSVGIQLFDSSYDYNLSTGTTDTSVATTDQNISKNRGATVTYGRSFGLFNNVSLAYTYSKQHTKTVSTLVDGSILPLPIQYCLDTTVSLTFTRECRYDISSLRPSYSYVSLDSRFEPTRGLDFGASVDFTGGPLGGTKYFYRPELGLTWFHPITDYPVRSVFGFNLSLGRIHPLQGKELTYYDFYHLGGENNSLRGFRYYSVGVLDSKGRRLSDQLGEVIGGKDKVAASLEYHFLLGGPFRVVLFGDAAGTFNCDPIENAECKDTAFTTRGLYYTAGAELRILVPQLGAPLRFIYAFNLKQRQDDQFEHFTFSIGTSF